MDRNIKVSVVLPCYNESENLKQIINRCKELDNSSENHYEFIFVNNGSSDNTEDLLDQNCNGMNLVKCTINKNIGYGNGIKQGIKIAKNDVIAWTHSDMQTDVFDIDRGIDFLSDKTSLVKGFRVQRKIMPKLLSVGMSVVTLIFQGTWISEINAQPKIISKEFAFKHLKNSPNDFSLDLFYCLHANKNKGIVKFPVLFGKREFGVSKGGEGNLKTKIKIILRSIKFIMRLKL